MAKTANGSSKVVELSSTGGDPTIDGSNLIIRGTASYDLFIGGTADLVQLSQGTDTVNAPLGGNTIDTGKGSDTIEISATGNVVDAGGGRNVITDTGSGNTFVLPAAGQGEDLLYGQSGGIKPGDVLDLRQLLGSTTWNGASSTLSDYLEVTTRGANAVVMARDISSDAWHAVLVIEESGPLTLSTLLSHAIT